MSAAEFDSLGGIVLCDPCQGILKKRTTARKLKQFKASRPDAPKCSKCGATEPRKHVKLDENLRDHYLLLCTGCGKKLRYTPVNYERYSMHIHGRGQAS